MKPAQNCWGGAHVRAGLDFVDLFAGLDIDCAENAVAAANVKQATFDCQGGVDLAVGGEIPDLAPVVQVRPVRVGIVGANERGRRR